MSSWQNAQTRWKSSLKRFHAAAAMHSIVEVNAANVPVGVYNLHDPRLAWKPTTRQTLDVVDASDNDVKVEVVTFATADDVLQVREEL